MTTPTHPLYPGVHVPGTQVKAAPVQVTDDASKLVTGTLAPARYSPSLSQALDGLVGGGQVGDVLVRGANGWRRVPVGGIGQALVVQSNGQIGWQNIVTGATGNVAPANTVLPTITPGTVQVGVTLTCDPGVFSGSPSPSIAYQWQRGDTLTDLTGATAQSYMPQPADVGHTLRCKVTADNGVGSPAVAYSPTSSAVLSNVTTAAPSVVVGPSISGSAVIGGVLTLSVGTWAGSPVPSFTRQWVYGDTGAAITGATGTSYSVQASDAGHTIRCVVTGSNGVGSPVTVTTSATGVVPGLAPVNSALPQIIPAMGAVGDTRTVTNGSWTSADPITYSYVWLRADTAEIVATTAAYTFQAADAGHFMQAGVVATNRWGASAAAYTSWTGQITGTTTGGGGGTGTTPTDPPTLVASPSISGSLTQGGSLTATPGTYNG